MFFKKFLSVILCIMLIPALTACHKDTAAESSRTQTDPVTEANTSNNADINTNITEAFTVSYSDNNAKTAAESAVTVASLNPSLWTKAEITEAYKNAAVKTGKTVKSEQTVTISDISINNGQFEGVIDFVMPIMSKLIANNTTEKEGITGGYSNLSESDVYEAKAYTTDGNTVIEMVMRNQTDGAHGDALGGSVGHAISTVGDISVVTDQLNDLGLPIEISEQNTSVIYTNPAVKVLIGKDGKIIKGTWRYTVEIRLNDYKVGGKTVETTSVVMDNIITVNGGF